MEYHISASVLEWLIALIGLIREILAILRELLSERRSAYWVA